MLTISNYNQNKDSGNSAHRMVVLGVLPFLALAALNLRQECYWNVLQILNSKHHTITDSISSADL